jgi:kynurenine formamidase
VSEYRLSEAEFHELARRLSNWGRWGADDEAGTLNFITPEKRRSAARLATEGITVSCSTDLPVAPAPDNPRPTRHLTYRAPDTQMGAAGDFLTLEPHGWTMTHLDAFSHIYYQGRFYNDRPLDDLTSAGARHGSVMAARDGIVSRGILIDVARAASRDWLDPGDAASPEDVRKALDEAGLEPGPGDILIFRTGRHARNAAQGTPPQSAGLAGISVACAEQVHNWQVAALICDGGMDTQPSEVENIRIPWHILTLTMMGMPIVDNAFLDDLAATCERLGRWEFLLTVAPLRLVGGTSSPLNPIAMF